MAIVSDRKMIYEKEIAELEKRKEQAAQRVRFSGDWVQERTTGDQK